MNPYFQFKQFTIHQEHCAMKVTELACIQGAWSPIDLQAKRILDIGSGTGLLSLMLAQRFPKTTIDTIEIELEAYHQAKENIKGSKFNTQIKLHHGDIRTHLFNHKFDFIICNPPFFEKQLQSVSNAKNQAWHSNSLNLKELLASINQNLNPDGEFSILLPIDRKEELENELFKLSYYPQQYLRIQHSETHPIKFFVGIYANQLIMSTIETINLKESNERSKELSKLMIEFYL